MPMEITLLNPLNGPEHQRPRIHKKHIHMQNVRAQISTQGSIEGKVYNELSIEPRVKAIENSSIYMGECV